MFRRMIFALMLIGAAFAGGALINGPGLGWLQRNFAGGPTIIVDPGDSARARPPAEPTPRKFPTAKARSLIADLSPDDSRSSPRSKTSGTTDLALAETPLLPESPATPAAALAPMPPTNPSEQDPPIPPLPSDDSKPTAPEPSPLPRLTPSPKSDPIARLASIERSESSPSGAQPSTWADLRRRMKALGVSRYAIEAETEGRARFRCVIPVDGLKAIGHHFEAEGDDELQAAEAALKRITLWKATAE